jgi:hypothetical protein
MKKLQYLVIIINELSVKTEYTVEFNFDQHNQ